MSTEIPCGVFAILQRQEPTPEMTEEFESFPEDVRDMFSYSQSKLYYKNEVEYNRKHAEWTRKCMQHFSVCSNADCQRLLKVWKLELGY